MHVTKEEIEAVKRSCSIVEVVESRGVKLKRQGANWVGLCPLHEEKSPSFTVYARTETFKCFGCGEQGDAIGFVCKFDKVSFPEAMAMLRGPASPATRKLPAKGNGKPIGKGNGRREPDQTAEIGRGELLGRVAAIYEAALSRESRGVEYLKTRGIEDPAALKAFRVGFAPGGLLKALGASEKADLASVGVLAASGREHFEGCVTVPFLDPQGAVVGMYGRRIDGREPRHLYLPGKLRGLVNAECAKEGKPVVVTEAILDALSLYEKGFRRAIPLYGANASSEELIEWLAGFQVREVYLAFDSDDAGEKGAACLAEKLTEKGIHGRVVRLPEKDVNEFFLRGHTLGEFEALLEAERKSAKGPQERLFETTPTGFRVQWGERLYETKAIVRAGTQLKTTLRVSKNGRSEISTIDLYSHRSRQSFSSDLSRVLGEDEALIEEDLRRVLEKVEGWQPGREEKTSEPTEAEREEALSLLRRPDLLDAILADFEALGYVGGDTNKLVSYLVATSRLLEEPLSLVIQSRSSAGKSALLDATLALMPPEAYVKYTRITDQALFYRDELSLRHKILALEESRGAGGATYSIQALQSNKWISIASTAKDPVTGRAIGYERKVMGPTAVMFATTDPVLDGELSSRCLVTTVDESREMTERIHRLQRESMTLEGLDLRVRREAVQKLHWNVQRLLKTYRVVNNLAPRLKFPSDKLRSRRDQVKYLYLINSIALLHQYQREVKKTAGEIEYIEVVEEDVRRANRLAREIFQYSLDELAQGSRKLSKAVDEMARAKLAELGISTKEYRFSRKDIRKWTGWTDFQIRDHIHQLVEMEVLYECQGKRGKEYVYELGYDPFEEVRIDLVDP